ncbi:uncharacterized protein EV422DRAFT_504489 [Fimicolochytrium jonesii]|uniref:uncharacterized protein n=1 Tax=Fimicolochytrium jonesii TaxID=1396493 RepID=UPI0022FDF3DA|nr:uncharacterized protein EV422DRAFT_504489 [Fimicolochytrium jonesii]KAI8824507.1 hypothetical protein EV422DRAFT_504489 [Fimicolochytrium jonesii]
MLRYVNGSGNGHSTNGSTNGSTGSKESFTVFVRHNGGGSVSMIVKPNMSFYKFGDQLDVSAPSRSIAELKQAVIKRFPAIQSYNLRLLCVSKELEDSWTISHYPFVREGSTIDVAVRCNGGNQ